MSLSINILTIFLFQTLPKGLPRSEDKRKNLMSKAKDHLGYKNDNMLDISPERIVLDILHKFLRVTDVLVDLLLDEIFRSDKFFTNTSFDPEIHLNLASLSQFLVNKCEFKSFGLENKAQDIRNYFKSLMGPKKRILFEIICSKNYLCQLFNNFHKKVLVSRLWECYWKIFETLRSVKNYSLCKEFLDLFLSIYQTSKITPYIHMLAFHIPELYAKYGPLNCFSRQGLEKLNDMTTSQYFKNTNKKWILQSRY
jgi:hypothetical protein